MKKLSAHFYIVLFIVFLLQACAGGNALPQTSIPAPSLTTAYPSDLAVASPYSTAVSGSLSLIKQMNKTLLDNPGATYQEKKAAFESIISSTTIDGCAFELNLDFTEERAACYGPEVDFSGHPDTLFGENNAGQLPHGDLGLWDELNEDGNACAASQMNALFSNVAGQVDSALGLFASTVCIASNNSIELPDENKSTELTNILQSAFTGNLGINLSVTSANIEREANDDSGNSIYNMSITAKDGADNSLTFTLRHSPLDSDNATYRGQLTFAISNAAPGFTVNCGAIDGSTSAATILYEKTSTTNLAYQLNRADFCGVDGDPFDANGNIDPEDKFDQNTNADGWANNYNRALININPETGESTVSYAWQAGANDENTRVFEASVTQEEDLLSGCAYYGFGDDVADTDTIAIDGFICNWAGPGSGAFGSKTIVEKAQRQCLLQDNTGLFSSDADTLAITYAPTNSCNSAGAGFIFDGITAPVTNNLIDIADIDFSRPNEPTPMD